MEITAENVALIVITLVTVALVGGIFLTLLSTQAGGETQDLIVELLDAKTDDNRTYFTLLVTFVERMNQVSVSTTSGPCSITTYDPNTNDRTVEIYGFCNGNQMGGVLVVEVEGPTKSATTNVKVG